MKYIKNMFCKIRKISYTSTNSSGNSKICWEESRGEREDIRKVKAYLLSCCCCWSFNALQLFSKNSILWKSAPDNQVLWSLRRGQSSGLIIIPILSFIPMICPLHSFLKQKTLLTKEFKLDFLRFSAGYIFSYGHWINTLWSGSQPFFRFFCFALDTSMV